MNSPVRNALRAAAELAVRTGQGGSFVSTARQELAAAVVDIGQAVAVNAEIAANAAGLSARSLRRHLAERREAMREEALDAVDGEPNERAMLELRALGRHDGGRVTNDQVLAVAKRCFPGSSKRHRFMRDVWVDHGWLVPDVRGGFRVSEVTSAYRPEPDRRVMADVRRQVCELLDERPGDPRPVAERSLRIPLQVDPALSREGLANAIREAVIGRLATMERHHQQGDKAEPRTLKVALVAAFDAPPDDDRALAVWAEARVTVPGTREMISVLTTDPIDETAGLGATQALRQDVLTAVEDFAPSADRPAVTGTLLVVTCFV